MKLNELNNIPWSPEDKEAIDSYYGNAIFSKKKPSMIEPEGVDDILQAYGWQPIGMGAFSDVYAKEGYEYVLKMNRTPDSAFAKFAILSRASRNPHFPHIGNGKIINIKGHKYIAYLIEFLEPIKMNLSKIQTLASVLNTIVNCAADNEIYSEASEYGFEGIEATVFESLTQSLFDAALYLGRYVSRQSEMVVDIHENNIMERYDGTIVITDPLYTHGEYQK